MNAESILEPLTMTTKSPHVHQKTEERFTENQFKLRCEQMVERNIAHKVEDYCGVVPQSSTQINTSPQKDGIPRN